MLTISICTAGGSGEEQDEEIRIGLFYMFCFLISLHKGKKYPTYLPPLPLLAKTCIEQIEEEGGHEEVDALLNNKGREMHIKVQAIGTYGYILNFFVDQSNTLSWWYNQGA
ncbi:MAG: hypothetical protein EZS28_009868 [Streblomastix strix]|uniref:Uncharacterized protein n=1 Tax=Streblomastix strix TaxID=222440 RepID=A0A5J4WJV2_9EUKA|nr:MAG: hypothetical protein EZS28_009868 [Streblomastix strix]